MSMSTNTNTNTKASTKAKAEAKAEASVKAAAAAVMAEASALSAVKVKAAAASTKAEHLAAAAEAARFVTEAEADAFWSAIVPGRMLIGAAIYGAAKAAMLTADANTKVKAAADMGFTSAAAACGFGTKATYEAAEVAKRPGPGRRSWSALAEDFNLYAFCADYRWRVGYEASLSTDDAPSVRGFLTFSRQAEAAEASEAEAKGTPQSRGAITKAKAKAEAERQAKAKADAKAKREREASEAAAKRLDHISHHPAASVVTGFAGLKAADLTSCYDLDVLDALAATIKAWRDHVAGMTAEARKAAATDGGADAPEAEASEASAPEASEAAVPAPDAAMAAMIAAAVKAAMAEAAA